MKLLSEAMNALGVVLLQLVVLLLFEELTFGGLVRLLFAPRPGAGRQREQNNRKEGGKCSH
jgi:hypothetical protein